MDRIDQIVNMAYYSIELAKSKNLTPSHFVMGFSLFYYVRARLAERYFCYNEVNSYGFLFGLPIRLTENSKYSLSLCCKEFSEDFEPLFEERRPI